MTEDSCPKALGESMASAATTRQRDRKKRKWDQPAECLISAGLAVPGILPLATGGLVGTGVSGSLLTNPSSTASQLFQVPAIQQNVAALVQKISQPKIQDELIAREIVINDAEPTVRYKLTKRQTQEEIQKCTGAVVITRGKYRPPNVLHDNEKPLYLHISAGAHLKDTAERIKAVDRAASMIEEILKQGQNAHPASTPFQSVLSSKGQVSQTLSKCLFLGFEPDPSLNIAARIRGPNDQYINHIMNETGSTVVLRGRGSGNLDIPHAEEAQQPLHLYLSSSNPKSLEDARILSENLLDTICVECGASRISSCKVYNAVPPPQQLMAGVQSSGKESNVNDIPNAGLSCSSIGSATVTQSFMPTVAPVSSGSNICPPGMVLQPGGMVNYGQPQSNVGSYSHISITGGTSYSGYGGIYPQATPLQQVALALRQAPASTTPVLAPAISAASMMPKINLSSSAETDKRPPQKRKFQELPVASNGPTPVHQNSRQGSEFLKPGLSSDDLGIKNVSSMPPPKKLVQPASNGMQPLPPMSMLPPPPRNMMPPPPPPPPPPKFTSLQSPTRKMIPPPPQSIFTSPRSPPRAEHENSFLKKSSSEPLSDTLLKLGEYGEEDEDVDGTGEQSSRSSSARITAAKPFWAV